MSISSGTYVNATPTGTVTIEGTAAERQTLTAVAATLADADGLGPLSWQWLRDGVVITGATASTYQLALEDVGHALSMRASYVDGLGQAESVTSAATAGVRWSTWHPRSSGRGPPRAR